MSNPERDSGTELAREEYAQLRNEMTQIQSNVRTLLGSVIAFYIAAAGAFIVVIGNLTKGGSLPPFMECYGLHMVSVLLLVIVVVALHVGYIWQRHSYFMGSYLLVFHENGHRNNFRWISTSRKTPPRTLGTNIRAIPLVEGLFLVVFALLPSGYAIANYQMECSSFASFALVFVVGILFLWFIVTVCWWLNIGEEMEKTAAA